VLAKHQTATQLIWMNGGEKWLAVNLSSGKKIAAGGTPLRRKTDEGWEKMVSRQNDGCPPATNLPIEKAIKGHRCPKQTARQIVGGLEGVEGSSLFCAKYSLLQKYKDFEKAKAGRDQEKEAKR